MRRILQLFIVTVGLVGPGVLPARAERYVSTTGSDAGNDCTSASSPCRTIGAAAAVVTSGETIEIAAGRVGDR